MNILLVVTGLPDKRSPAKCVFNLTFAEKLTKAENHVSFLYLRSINPKRPFLRKKVYQGISCFECSCVLPNIGPIKGFKFLNWLFMRIINNRKFKKKLNTFNIIHAIGGQSIEASHMISKKYSIPFIAQFIGSDVNVYMNDLLERRGFRAGVDQSKYICFNSQNLQREFVNRVGITNNTKVLYRGVSINDFKYFFDISKEITILFLGGFPANTNLKGGITLLESIRVLNRKELLNDVKIIIGGPNSLNYKHSLNFINNKKLRIKFIGAIDKQEVKKKMHDSHIVLIPSLAEGIPNVLYEAMACGNLIIASKVGGIAEIIEDGKTGDLIPANDSHTLAEKLVFYTNNVSLIEDYAIEGRRRIEKMDYQNFINEYLKIYNQLIN